MTLPACFSFVTLGLVPRHLQPIYAADPRHKAWDDAEKRASFVNKLRD